MCLHCSLITTASSFSGRTFTFFGKQRSCFLPRFWMSLSFNSLRSIMTIHYLCLYSVFKVHRLMSNNRNGTRRTSFCFVTCFALCFIITQNTYKQAWRVLSSAETHCSLLAWRWWDSNSWPPACKAGALPTELHPQMIWHPPALPCRLQHSTIGRLSLNHRVRDENGCVP